MNITAILIQRILVFQAKFLLFMTFWTNIEPYHMFYIVRRNVTLKIDRTWEEFGSKMPVKVVVL